MAKEEGEEERHRVVVLVGRNSHPELFGELSRVGNHFRAERLRLLATTSLMQQNGMVIPAAVIPLQGEPEEAGGESSPSIVTQQEKPALDEREQRMLSRRKRLAGSFDAD